MIINWAYCQLAYVCNCKKDMFRINNKHLYTQQTPAHTHVADLICLSSGQHGGAQHPKDRGQASEGYAVQQNGQHAILGEEETGAAESHKGAGGWDQGLQRNAQPAAQDQWAGEAETQVKKKNQKNFSCDPKSHILWFFSHGANYWWMFHLVLENKMISFHFDSLSVLSWMRNYTRLT